MEARVYYKIDGYDNFPTIHLSDMEVFESMLEKYQPAYILVANDSVTEKGEKDLIGRNKTVNKAVTRLAFEHNGVLYSVNSRNFTSIKDYKDAGLKGFDNGLDYYAASEGNFIDKEEYDNCKAAGFDDRVEYLKAQNLDFEGGIEKLKEANENGKISDGNFSKIKDLTTDAQVYNFAKNFGYDSYEEFENALSSGFVKSDATDYREAVEKGFDSSDAFYSAKKGSFSGLDEYQQANVLGIEDQREFQKYNELSNLREQYGFRSMEQAHLFDELALLGEGKKLSITRIWDMLKEAQKSITFGRKEERGWLDRPIAQIFGGGASLPDWYSTSFKDIVELKVFMISNENIGRIGAYDADGEVFERRSMAEVEVEAEVAEIIEDAAEEAASDSTEATEE